jgi:hypothetical protein
MHAGGTEDVRLDVHHLRLVGGDVPIAESVAGVEKQGIGLTKPIPMLDDH